MSAVDDIQQAAEKVKAEGKSKPRVGRHLVNQTMVDHWLDAMGDKNPIYVDEAAAKAAGHPGIAPRAMIRSGRWQASAVSVRPMIRLRRSSGCSTTQDVSAWSRPTASRPTTGICGRGGQRHRRVGRCRRSEADRLGEGYFISQRITWQVGDEDVAEMMWRIMKFKPAEGETGAQVPDDLDANAMMRPASSRDTKFFWDGVNAHELRIQKRGDGSLKHPPVPALWQDKEAPTDYVVASGKGTVFSFVVHHAPKGGRPTSRPRSSTTTSLRSR